MQTIPPKTTRVVNAVVRIPDPNKLQKGRTLTLVAMADAPIAAADTSISPNARIDEANEGNNTRQLKVKVPGGIGGMTVGQRPNQGQAPTRNLGPKRVNGSSKIKLPPAQRTNPAKKKKKLNKKSTQRKNRRKGK